MNFEDTILAYTPEEARAEAGRCLDCHEICSLCVGVCPNMALMTYLSDPFVRYLPVLRARGGSTEVVEEREFRADQRFQISVLTDFCNECGNCETFCPTSGEPYRDKPRLYLDRADFEAQDENAFMMFREGESTAIEARWGGETHRLELDGQIRYESPALNAILQPQSLALIEATPGDGVPEGQQLTLEACASMYVVLKGISESMPQIPWAQPQGGSPAGTRIGHPGYEE